MKSQRLNDRIHELCARAVSTPESPELDDIFQQLQEALHEHTSRLRKRATQMGKPERRVKEWDRLPNGE